PAFADSKCTLGRGTYGDNTVVVNGISLQSYNNLNDAIDGMNKVRSAGLCEEGPSKCTLAKGTYGDITTVVDGVSLHSSNAQADAIASIVSLRNAGLCDAQVKSNCGLGKGTYGDITVLLNGQAMQSNNNLKDAMASIQKLSDAGLCGEFRPNDLGSCRVARTANGISIYMDNGASLIGTYPDSYVARAVFQALVNSGSCKRTF
ncbi:MAG: hypothetical protein ACXVBL_19100, partial [Bdellovibrionota bacterium]